MSWQGQSDANPLAPSVLLEMLANTCNKYQLGLFFQDFPGVFEKAFRAHKTLAIPSLICNFEGCFVASCPFNSWYLTLAVITCLVPKRGNTEATPRPVQ